MTILDASCRPHAAAAAAAAALDGWCARNDMWLDQLRADLRARGDDPEVALRDLLRWLLVLSLSTRAEPAVALSPPTDEARAQP
jgi:hypothetical protein